MKNTQRNLLVALGTVALLTVGACAKQEAKTSKVSGLQNVYFDFDRADITPAASKALKSNAEYLKAHDKKQIVIEGNCDERGTNEYNIALGDRRARAAKNFLVNAGVDKKGLSTISYGEEKPAASCHDESCWSKNRRDEFKSK